MPRPLPAHVPSRYSSGSTFGCSGGVEALPGVATSRSYACGATAAHTDPNEPQSQAGSDDPRGCGPQGQFPPIGSAAVTSPNGVATVCMAAGDGRTGLGSNGR